MSLLLFLGAILFLAIWAAYRAGWNAAITQSREIEAILQSRNTIYEAELERLQQVSQERGRLERQRELMEENAARWAKQAADYEKLVVLAERRGAATTMASLEELGLLGNADERHADL